MYRDSLFYLNFTSKPRNVQISLFSRPLLTITDLNKFGMPNFGHSKFLPVFLYLKGFNKFGMCIFGHPEFIPVFLGKIVKKIWNGHFWPFQIYTSLFGKNCQKIQNGHFLAIPNLYQSFWEKLLEQIWNGHFLPFQIYTSLFGKNSWKKCGTTIFGHSKFIPVFLGKIVRKNSEQPFLGHSEFFSDNFSAHITLIECNGLESNEICTFLDFYSEI